MLVGIIEIGKRYIAMWLTIAPDSDKINDTIFPLITERIQTLIITINKICENFMFKPISFCLKNINKLMILASPIFKFNPNTFIGISESIYPSINDKASINPRKDMYLVFLLFLIDI